MRPGTLQLSPGGAVDDPRIVRRSSGRRSFRSRDRQGPRASGERRPWPIRRADVEAGQRLYGPQCQVCHGANGDGVPGIDLSSGRFRARVIGRGSGPGDHERRAGHRHAAFRAAARGAHRYRRLHPRRLRSTRPRRRASAMRARGSALFEGKGDVRHLPPRQRQRPAARARPERHRRDPHVGRAAALAARTHESHDADQPAGAHRDEGWPHDHAAAGSTRTPIRCSSSTTRSSSCSLARPTCKQLTVETTATMPSYQDRLSAEELADVIAYLLTLRGL